MIDRYFCRQALLILNQLAVIGYIFLLWRNDTQLPHNVFVQLGLITFILFDAYYVSYQNIRNNSTLGRFSLLLTIVTWYFLIGLSNEYHLSEISKILLSLVSFQTLGFTLAFLFQDTKYKYKDIIHITMGILCGGTILCGFISENAFNFCLLMQFILTALIIIFVAIMHRNRMVFILKNQKVPILLSLAFVLVPFGVYSLYFLNDASKLERTGEYLICLLCFASIHGIIFCSGRKTEKRTSLAFILKMVLVVLGVLFAALFCMVFELPAISIFVLIYSAHLMIQIYNMFLYVQTRKKVQSGGHEFYSNSLTGIRREEALKSEISEFLHDNVLQDLLSVKILVKKSEKPEIKELIADTLEKLSDKVRVQMNQYHPVLLKSLTLKENYQNLIESTIKAFPLTNTEIVFNCRDDLFLADPYNVMIYRMMKELMTNALKHSAAKIITISLFIKKEQITLAILDDGIGFDPKNRNIGLHKGLASVYDAVYSLEGSLELDSKVGQGTEVLITLPMKGERSYESFTSR